MGALLYHCALTTCMPRSFLAISFFMLALMPLRAQDCEFDLGPDQALCNGENVLLAGPSGSVSLRWQNGSGAQYITADASGTYACTATFPVPGQDLAVNGDFSDGDVGFTTDLSIGIGGTWGPLSFEGTYGLTTDQSLLHSNFPSCADHTGGGQMLLVNGSAVPDANIWCQTITVQPNTTYAFSAWLMSASPESPAILDFTVNGTPFGAPLLASSTTCQWAEFYALWESGSTTSASICITNQNLATSGNDFALDDIAFRPLCTYTDSVLITILPPEPAVVVTGAATLCPGDLVVLQASLDPPGGPFGEVSFVWNTGAGGPTYTASTAGYFEATATGTCLDATGSITIAPDTCVSALTMPNVFSPNGDGFNDVFLPMAVGQPEGYNLEVRNRWGQVVFNSTNVNTGWDGRIQGQRAADGTYFWTVRYSDRLNDGRLKEQDKAGHVTLVGTP